MLMEPSTKQEKQKKAIQEETLSMIQLMTSSIKVITQHQRATMPKNISIANLNEQKGLELRS